MLDKIDLTIINAVSENGFDRMDYNNQVNFMWCMVDMAAAREKRMRYDWTYFPYQGNNTLALAETLPHAGIDKLRTMAMKLRDMGTRTKLMDLIAA